jgi:hypothetical protein
VAKSGPDTYEVPEGATVRQVWADVTAEGCSVALLTANGNGEFHCLTCGASGYTDGYTETEDGAAAWHASL